MASKAKKRQRSEARHAARQERKKATAAANPVQRVQGEGFLCEPSTMAADMTLMKQAVIEEFPISAEMMKTSVDRLEEIKAKKTFLIPCGEGVFESEAVAASMALKAIEIQNKMIESNIKRRNQPSKQTGQTTINVGVSVDNRVDERRNQLIALGERFRSGSVLVTNTTGTN